MLPGASPFWPGSEQPDDGATAASPRLPPPDPPPRLDGETPRTYLVPAHHAGTAVVHHAGRSPPPVALTTVLTHEDRMSDDTQMADRGDLRSFLDGIFDFPEFSAALTTALEHGPPAHAIGADRGAARWVAFDRLASEAWDGVRTHPQAEMLFRLFEDASRLNDEEVVGAFDFIGSGIAQAWKSRIAQALARPIVDLFCERLTARDRPPTATVVVPGGRFEVDRLGEDGGSKWGAGPEALVLAADPPTDGGLDADAVVRDAKSDPVIVAIVEIKSSRRSVQAYTAQVKEHVQSLARGLRFDGEGVVHAPPSFMIRPRDGGCHIASPAPGDRVCNVPFLVVLPRRDMRDPADMARDDGVGWIAELPATKAELLEAGFRLARWLILRIGAGLFGARTTPAFVAPSPRATPARHDATPADAAEEALRASLDSVDARGIFLDCGPPGTVHARARQAFCWLRDAKRSGRGPAAH